MIEGFGLLLIAQPHAMLYAIVGVEGANEVAQQNKYVTCFSLPCLGTLD